MGLKSYKSLFKELNLNKVKNIYIYLYLFR